MDKVAAVAYLRPLAPMATGVQPRGAPTAPIKCLLCDIYGTLFISASGDIGATGHPENAAARLDELLERHGLSVTSSDLQERLNHAIKARHAESRSQGIDFPEVVIESIWQKILPTEDMQQSRDFAIEFEMMMNPVWPMPGVQSLLASCVTRNIALGIISNAQFFTPYLFNWLLHASPSQLGFDPDLTYYSYVYGRAKPSPFLFELARQHLLDRGIEAQHVAFIGNDMRNDILPARNVGFQTILFAGDRRSLRMRENDPPCSEIKPNMVVNALSQLEQLVNAAE